MLADHAGLSHCPLMLSSQPPTHPQRLPHRFRSSSHLCANLLRLSSSANLSLGPFQAQQLARKPPLPPQPLMPQLRQQHQQAQRQVSLLLWPPPSNQQLSKFQPHQQQCLLLLLW